MSGRFVEAEEHDVTPLPNGMLLHHSTCWCKKKQAEERVAAILKPGEAAGR